MSRSDLIVEALVSLLLLLAITVAVDLPFVLAVVLAVLGGMLVVRGVRPAVRRRSSRSRSSAEESP